MFERLRRLFGGGKQHLADEPSEAEIEAQRLFDEQKQASLDSALGKMEDMVVHAIIPFFIGGGLDLYRFRRHIPGTLYVTQELFTRNKADRPKRSGGKYFELAVAFRDDEDMAVDDNLPPSTVKASELLNPIAHYVSEVSLKPGETAEVPGEDGEPNTCLLFSELDLHGKSLAVNGEPFFLLCVTQIHPSELELARKDGSEMLIERLKAKGYFPYSDLDRPPVA